MSGSLVADLGLGPRTWLFLSLIACVAIFFKFTRVLSVRNLDLFLVFSLAPGLMALVGSDGSRTWMAYAWLLGGSTLIFVRSLLDLAIVRRPLLEPNLNAPGMICLIVGVLALLLTETVNLPRDEGAARNPADPGALPGEKGLPAPKGSMEQDSPVNMVLKATPLPRAFQKSPPQVVISRALAVLSHVVLVLCLNLVCRRHFNLPIAGLACATCYLLLPYTRIAVVDSGQLVSAALILAAVAFYQRPIVAALFIGLAAGWTPACLGLLPLWATFYRKRAMLEFALISVGVILGCVLLSQILVPDVGIWARALALET